jgi:hypothetical protein
VKLLVSHDAGGAELLSSWLRRQEGADVACVLEGPARAIFARKLGKVRETRLAEGIAGASSLLCGSSWQSTLERDALAMARAQRVPSASFIDHWINYRERFELGGQLQLPDELWVGDEHARERAAAAFPGLPLRLVDNPYFQDIRREAAGWPPRPRGEGLSVLYVTEPVSDFGHMPGVPASVGYDERGALTHFLRRLGALGAPVAKLRLRPHPSEPAEKYRWAIGFEGLPVEAGGIGTLMEEIAAADVVAGVESMALVTALIAGRRTLSCIPPGGRACVLPFPEIERFG